MNKKRGQSQISFGMIFSILLIIFFIAFAIYGIVKFLEVQRLAQVGKFKIDFQADITTMSQSTQGSQPETYYPPKKIKQVCFATRTNPRTGKDENMYFMPDDASQYDGDMLNNLNIAKTTAGSTSVPKKLCIDVINGKVSLTLKKEYNENSVTIIK
jgi:hypothetical protein